MGYYTTHIIAIRTGGVFSGRTDIQAIQAAILAAPNPPTVRGGPDFEHSVSPELNGSKGGVVVIAGTFNYWNYVQASEFCKELSKLLTTEIIHTFWDQQTEEVRVQMYLDGKESLEIHEDPLGKVLRRVAG